MHNKIFFTLKKFVSILAFLLLCNSVMSQNYVGFNKRDVIMIKGNFYTETKKSGDKLGVINYTTPNIKYHKEGTSVELFSLDDNDIVIRYIRMDEVDEDEVLKIVKANNQDYKRVDIGGVQNDFQWLDTKKQLDIKLTVIPFEKGLISDLKFYQIIYVISKE
jgi:hypothetical protein